MTVYKQNTPVQVCALEKNGICNGHPVVADLIHAVVICWIWLHTAAAPRVHRVVTVLSNRIPDQSKGGETMRNSAEDGRKRSSQAKTQRGTVKNVVCGRKA